MKVLLVFLMLVSNAYAENKASSENREYFADGTRIRSVDSTGNTQYHKESYVVKNGRIYQTDSIGNIQYHKGSLKIEKPPIKK